MVARYRKRVEAVNRFFEKYTLLSAGEIRALTLEFKQRYQKGASLDDLLEEAYAAVKAMCLKMQGECITVMGHTVTWNMVPYDVQIIGAIAMFKGNIAEMQTGEGKTLTATLPLYLHALTGKPVHLVTVNDYLAERDRQWAGILLEHMGLTTASLTQDIPGHERAKIYEADVVYGTASEFGFDYLRDNSMAQNKNQQVQRGHYFAIVDEIDSILIDEARTPLIISGPSAHTRHMYQDLQAPVAELIRHQRDQSARLATEAKNMIDDLHILQGEEFPKLDKAQNQKWQEAIRDLWKVMKSTPRNRLLMKLREAPVIRKALEAQDIEFYNEANKQERDRLISELFIVVDERKNEFELTDLGIETWAKIHQQMKAPRDASQDFIMLDLGHEYLSVDHDEALSEPERMQRKIAIREEDSHRKERAHNLRQLLRAHLLMDRDVDYIIDENKIVIIDENTGRPQPGRRFSDGLHQAIEAKEGVDIQRETQTYATITLQNYFRLYDHLAGMSGTAITEEKEFKETYGIGVVSVPTYLKCERKDAEDLIYMSEREKYIAILKDVKEIHGKGRPILIGTDSVETSEKLSRIFKQNNLPHTVLNAKNHAAEAEIVAAAGQRGAITISTNMAGRGTDIKLGQGVAELGGLHVIGTTRHQSRRIDRQLRGRCARMGDPGSSQFYVCFEDQLLRLFANERITSILQRFRPPEGEPISSSLLTRSIETAQKRIEQHHFNIRKHTLEYDNVMNLQRSEIYSFRNEILQNESIYDLAKEQMARAVENLLDNMDREGEWSKERFCQYLESAFPISFEAHLMPDKRQEAKEFAIEMVERTFDFKMGREKAKFENLPQEALSIIDHAMRMVMLRRLDFIWQQHLLQMDHLRSEVQLQALGSRDPLIEYKQESFTLFQKMCENLHILLGQDLLRFELMATPRQEEIDIEEVKDEP